MSNYLKNEKQARLVPQILKKGDSAWSLRGKILENEFFLVKIIKKNEGILNFGVIVKKKIGNAVMRNLIKRRFRHAFRFLSNMHSDFAERSISCLIIIRGKKVATSCFITICKNIYGSITGQPMLSV